MAESSTINWQYKKHRVNFAKKYKDMLKFSDLNWSQVMLTNQLLFKLCHIMPWWCMSPCISCLCLMLYCFRVSDEKDARCYLQALAAKMTDELDSLKMSGTPTAVRTFITPYVTYLCVFFTCLASTPALVFSIVIVVTSGYSNVVMAALKWHRLPNE